jgi:ComF family protein
MSLPELSRGQPVAPVCGQCVLHPPPLDACAAAVDYAFPWDRLIAHLKFSPRHRADAALARPLADLLCAQPRVIELLLQADVVLPMPLSRQRLSDRGFNQSLLLCQHLLGSPRVRHQPRPQLQQQWLLRTVDTLPQHDLPRSQRLVNVRNAFAIDPLCSAFLHQKRVVIVDDVMTTGASMFAAAQCVHQAGAAHVAGIVLARTALAT